MSTLKTMLLILLLLLPLGTSDGDGQATPRGGVPSAVSSRVARLLGGDKKSGRSLEKRCSGGKTCGGGEHTVCCRRADCTCRLLKSRPWSRLVCVCDK